MNPSILDRTLKAYRIGAASNRYPIFDGSGSVLFPGRWNSSRTRVIYCSEHYSTALLEKLVHFNTGKIPTNQHWIEITIPVGTEYEIVTNYSLPGWNEPSQSVSQAFGEAWLLEKRSAILIVPSVVVPVENNILVNEFHPQFSTLTTSINQPVIWDRRLFSSTL